MRNLSVTVSDWQVRVCDVWKEGLWWAECSKCTAKHDLCCALFSLGWTTEPRFLVQWSAENPVSLKVCYTAVECIQCIYGRAPRRRRFCLYAASESAPRGHFTAINELSVQSSKPGASHLLLITMKNSRNKITSIVSNSCVSSSFSILFPIFCGQWIMYDNSTTSFWREDVFLPAGLVVNITHRIRFIMYF